MSCALFSGIAAGVAGGIGCILNGLARMRGLQYVDTCRMILEVVGERQQRAAKTLMGSAMVQKIADAVRYEVEAQYAEGRNCAQILADAASSLGIRASLTVGGVLLAGSAAVAAVALTRWYRNRARQKHPAQSQSSTTRVKRESTRHVRSVSTLPRADVPKSDTTGTPTPTLVAVSPPPVRPVADGMAAPLSYEERVRAEQEKRRDDVIAGTTGKISGKTGKT